MDTKGVARLARLIPTHAGKTPSRDSESPTNTAHPHSRGENARVSRRVPQALGSSPLTRGKPRRWPLRHRAQGLIPTHAGKTPQLRASARRTKAHPHSRGENGVGTGVGFGDGGSSPLTRGKHFLTCTFIAQIDQILESLELCASSESYSSQDAYATDALQGRVRSIDLGLRSSRDAS